MRVKVKLIIEGGKATPAPPLGPRITQLGLKPPEVVKRINDATADYEGLKVPVEIEVDKQTKEYTVKVYSPPVSQLLIKAAKIEKGFGDRKESASISFDDVKEIARQKAPSSLARSEQALINEILGSCLSMGLKVDGRDPREFIRKQR
ncbi:MAG: 50S ribosomal protein L11 [Candidatus Parvarchaeota archaeon]|nr:50S ribosomal protein L11 [Candidatus Parvarchaeota archaeon]